MLRASWDGLVMLKEASKLDVTEAQRAESGAEESVGSRLRQR